METRTERTLKAVKVNKLNLIHRRAPHDTEGVEFDQRFVEMNGDYFLYYKVDGTWQTSPVGSQEWADDVIGGVAMATNIWIKDTVTSTTEESLSDSTNWNTRSSLIKYIKIVTVSTDYDLWLYSTSAFNDTLIDSFHIARNATETFSVGVDLPYNSDDYKVYIKYTDNDPAGPYSTDILIMGEKRHCNA